MNYASAIVYDEQKSLSPVPILLGILLALLSCEPLICLLHEVLVGQDLIVLLLVVHVVVKHKHLLLRGLLMVRCCRLNLSSLLSQLLVQPTYFGCLLFDLL